MVNVCVEPSQLFAVGVTTIVAVIGAPEVFIAVNDVISPEPVEANPIDCVSFVHEYDVPLTPNALVNVTSAVASLLHTVCEVTTSTVGVGLIVIVT